MTENRFLDDHFKEVPELKDELQAAWEKYAKAAKEYEAVLERSYELMYQRRKKNKLPR